MGFSKYPNSLDDSLSLPPSLDLITPVKAEVVNRHRDALLAIETELGIQPSGIYGNVKDRIDAMQAQITTIAQDLDAVEAELGTDPSGAFDTVADRLASIATQIFNLQTDLAALTVRVTDVETELGTNPSGAFATVVARLDDSDATLAGLTVFAEVVTPLISGFQETDSDTFVARGAAVLNPTTLGHPSATFTLEVILQSTTPSFDGYFELFNITENLTVSHDVIQVSSTVPTFFTATLTIDGADLPASQNNILEGRIRLETGAAASDRAICKYAAIRSKVT